VSGHAGAGHIAVELGADLQRRGEQLDFLLDEGMFVMQGVVPGVENPVIYIGNPTSKLSFLASSKPF
jgi:carboxypeptidase PM20D1